MSEWQSIETAPKCVGSGPEGSGARSVIVTRHPITGAHHPMAIARLTQKGKWRTGKSSLGTEIDLWFMPTHWIPLPEPPK